MFICKILVDWYFPQFCKSDMSKYGYLEVLQRVPLTSSRLYINLTTQSISSFLVHFR